MNRQEAIRYIARRVYMFRCNNGVPACTEKEDWETAEEFLKKIGIPLTTWLEKKFKIEKKEI